MELSGQRQWAEDPDLGVLDVDPDEALPSMPLKKVPAGDIYEAARAGDVDRLSYLIESGVNINARDRWDSVALYYACLAGHAEAARMLLRAGAICSERTFDGDRCHYASLNLRIRRMLKAFETRPPPMGPLQGALRDTFLGCRANKDYLDLCDEAGIGMAGYHASDDRSDNPSFPPDVTFFIGGRPLEAHRLILGSRSPFFNYKFQTDWKDRSEVRFAAGKLSYAAFFSLIHFFYSDRLDIAVNDMEELVRVCKACKCDELQKSIEAELRHQKNADYKALKEVDNSQKRFILQASSLPEQDRLPSAMHRVLQASLSNSSSERLNHDDVADLCVRVGGKIFRCHQVILASRSEYFKARFSRMTGFMEGSAESSSFGDSLPVFEEHGVSIEGFEKVMEYMYTDSVKELDPDQAEELFDAASRYLLFPLKRVVADALLPHLELASPAELCHWLVLADMALLLALPPPSGDSSLRTTRPSAPGAEVSADVGNILDDLREKWLAAEAAELDCRDDSAAQFDSWLAELMLMAEEEATTDNE
ncbi:ankyrin repeat family protein isoform X2 [Wolffia australiana]